MHSAYDGAGRAGWALAQAALPGGTATFYAVSVLVVGLAALLVGLLLVSRRQERRDLRLVAQALEDVRAGRILRHVDVDPGSPVGYLAESVRRLGEDLHARTRDATGADDKLRAVLDASRDLAVLTTDPDADIRSAGLGIATLFGWDEEEIAGRPVSVLFHAESWKDLLPRLSRRSLRERGIDCRVEACRKDGTRFPARVSVRPFPGPAGSLLFLLKDVSVEAGLEASLEESEARYRALFEGLAEGVFLAQQGRIVLANPALEALCGVRPGALEGTQLRDRVDTRDLLVVEDRLAALESGKGSEPSESAFTLLDADRLPTAEVRLRASAVLFAGRPAVLGVVRDETAERLVGEELRRNETRLDAVLEAASDGILLLAHGPGGDVARMTNRAFVTIAGVTEGDVLGASEAELLRVLRERGGGAEVIAAFLASARGTRVERIVLATDPPRVLEVRLSTLTRAGGEMLGRVLACRDITDQRAFEERLEENAEALRRSRTDLESSHAKLLAVQDDLTARHAEEERLNRELKALDEMKTNLLANVSHELQTPLVSIRGYTEMILRERLGSINEEQRRGLTLSLTNIDRLITMIDNLLDFTRAAGGEDPLELTVFPLGSVVHEVFDLVRERASARRVELRATLADADLAVHADRDKIVQVLLNLVTNAVKFNRDGGLVEVSAAAGKVGTLDVRVRDSGVGIPTEDLERVFDRYYRGKAADGTSTEGYGIGLSLVRNLLRMHGGSIRAESEVGRGSVFCFTLPAAGARVHDSFEAVPDPTPASDAPSVDPGAPRGARPRFRIIRNRAPERS